jgi:hypothetical protein
VSQKIVRLQRVIPMVHNSFKPFFIGHFEVRGDVTVLIGKFTMLPLAKVFMSFWFVMCGLFAGAALLGGLKPEGLNATFFLLQPFLMIGGGIALVAAGKWFARNDAAWLSALIATALVAGMFGPRLWARLGQAGEGTAPRQLGNWNFVYAILVIALSIGIWSRRLWAWCGFLLLGLSVCWSLFVISGRADVGPPAGMKMIFAIFSCLVVGIWGLWWYAQRKHFLPN